MSKRKGRYTVTRANPDGSVARASEFQAYATSRQAHAAAARWAAGLIEATP